jgi:hypothetical protein
VLRSLEGKDGFRGRGLLGRFLYSLPRNTVGSREIDPPAVPEEVASEYRENIRRLLELQARAELGRVVEHELWMEPVAIEVFGRLQRRLEPLLAPDAELGEIADWASKLAGAVLRIGGVLHLASGRDFKDLVSGGTIEHAIAIGEYFLEHARLAFVAMGDDGVVDGAERILRWIRAQHLKEFSKRDAYRALRGSLRRAEALDRPLALLEDCGYIRRRPPPAPSGPGRRPGPSFEVNPLALRTHQTRGVSGLDSDHLGHLGQGVNGASA